MHSVRPHVKLVLVIGPSGAGKTSLIETLERLGGGRVRVISSEVTRELRQGDHYRIHVTREEFLERKKDNHYLETAEVYGELYGTPRGWLSEKDSPEHIHILEVDVRHGLKSMHFQFPYSFVLGVVPPSTQVLTKRVTKRCAGNIADLERRLHDADEEVNAIAGLHYAGFVQHIFTNYSTTPSVFELRVKKLLPMLERHFHIARLPNITLPTP